MKIGACYIRVSTTEQTEYSPESQFRMIREYADRNNIVLPEEYIYRDEGISGRSTEKRPAFQKMITAAKKKSFDVILVYSTSRFSRNHEQSIVYRSMLERECGVEVISITQPNVDKKTDMLTNAIYSIIDEWYSLDLADNVRRGMTEKAMRGEYQTYAPLGYEHKMKGDTIAIKEDEVWIIRYIFNEFINGKSLWYIAQYLNSVGVKSRRGTSLNTRTLYYIIRNPIYIGYTRWTTIKKRAWDFENENTIIAKGKHEPIIDEETFKNAQKMLKNRKSIPKTKTRPQETMKHWLSGLLKCSVCGRTLSYNASTKVRRSPSFKCSGYNRGVCTTPNSIIAKEAEKYILEYLNEAFANENILYNANIEIKDNDTERIAILADELKKINNRFERAKQGFLNGIFEIEEFKKLKEEYEVKTSDIKKQMKRPDKREIDYLAMQKEIASVYTILTKESFDKDEKQKAMRSIVKRIVYDKKSNKFSIYFFR